MWSNFIKWIVPRKYAADVFIFTSQHIYKHNTFTVITESFSATDSYCQLIIKVADLSLQLNVLLCWHYIAYLCTKFDHSSLSRSRDMVGVHENLNGSRDLTTSVWGTICRPRARTCCDCLAYQIWSLYLQPLKRYERDTKMRKMGWFGIARGYQGHWK